MNRKAGGGIMTLKTATAGRAIRPHRHGPGFPPISPPLWDEIQAAGVETFGSAAAGDFPWPLGRRQALEMLNAFIRHGLPHFGQFQDALSLESPTLFHSGLSFALNVKMLHPSEVIEAALTAWRAGAAPLTATEGFIRQILGWREYVRAGSTGPGCPAMPG